VLRGGGKVFNAQPAAVRLGGNNMRSAARLRPGSAEVRPGRGGGLLGGDYPVTVELNDREERREEGGERRLYVSWGHRTL